MRSQQELTGEEDGWVGILSVQKRVQFMPLTYGVKKKTESVWFQAKKCLIKRRLGMKHAGKAVTLKTKAMWHIPFVPCIHGLSLQLLCRASQNSPSSKSSEAYLEILLAMGIQR